MTLLSSIISFILLASTASAAPIGDFTRSALSAPLFFGQHRKFLTFKAEPAKDHIVEIYRQHPYGIDGMLLAMTVEARSDGRGRLEPGQTALKNYFSANGIHRAITPAEATFADEILLKTSTDTTFDTLNAETAAFLKKHFDPAKDEVYVVIRSKDSGDVAGVYVQELNAVGAGIKASQINLDPRPIAEGGQNLDGFVLMPPVKGKTKVPVVVVWGGSGGTIPKAWVSAFAQNGIAAVGVRYFSYDPADTSINSGAITHLIKRTPLEIFKRAVEYAKTLPGVDPQQVSVLGESRGGEGALLFAQYYGNSLGIHSVIANRPLHFAVGSKVSESLVSEPDVSSWSFQGMDLPFAAAPDDVMQFPETIRLNKEAGTLGKISWWQPEGNIDLPLVNLRPFFEALNPPKDAYVDVSGFSGNILALAGTKDLLWPSEVAVRAIARQRPGRNGDYFVNIKGGGHYVQVGRASNNIVGECEFELGAKGKESEGQRIIARDGGVDRTIDGIHELLNEYLVLRSIKGGKTIRSAKDLPFKEFIEQN